MHRLPPVNGFDKEGKLEGTTNICNLRHTTHHNVYNERPHLHSTIGLEVFQDNLSDHQPGFWRFFLWHILLRDLLCLAGPTVGVTLFKQSIYIMSVMDTPNIAQTNQPDQRSTMLKNYGCLGVLSQTLSLDHKYLPPSTGQNCM